MEKIVKIYRVIAKVGDDKFVKYHVNNLVSFSSFLDKNFPDWRWFNVFDKKTGIQVGNYTKKDRPIRSKV
jgi:ABC-type uncharacterized transport system permease subunit